MHLIARNKINKKCPQKLAENKKKIKKEKRKRTWSRRLFLLIIIVVGVVTAIPLLLWISWTSWLLLLWWWCVAVVAYIRNFWWTGIIVGSGVVVVAAVVVSRIVCTMADFQWIPIHSSFSISVIRVDCLNIDDPWRTGILLFTPRLLWVGWWIYKVDHLIVIIKNFCCNICSNMLKSIWIVSLRMCVLLWPTNKKNEEKKERLIN